MEKMPKNFNSWKDARKVLGDDFWEMMSDVLPNPGPRIDVYKSKGEVTVVVELPGLHSQEDISLKVSGYTLIVEGEMIRPYSSDEDGMLQDERFHGPFKRKVKLPKSTFPERMIASYRRGLLVVKIPNEDDDIDDLSQRVDIDFYDD